MDIAVLKVRFEGDTSAMDRAFDSATKRATGFKSTVAPLVNVSFTADVSGFTSAMRTISEAANSARASVIEQFRRIRLSAANGVTLAISADTSQLTQAQGVVTTFKQTVESVNAKIPVTVDLSGLTTAETRVAAFKVSIGNDPPSVRINIDTDAIPQAIAKLDLLDNKASGMDQEWGNSISIHAVVAILAAMTALLALDALANRINGRSVRVNASAGTGLTSVVPAALGDVSKQLSASQSAMAAFHAVSAVVIPAALGGIVTYAVGAAGALATLAGAAGVGLAGAVGVGGTAVGLAGAALYTYGFAVLKAGQYAFDFNNIIKSQIEQVSASKKALAAANSMLSQAIPGTQEYANAERAVAFAAQDLAFQIDKQNALLSIATPAMFSLTQSANEFQLAMIGIGGAMANAAAPALQAYLDMATSQLPLLTPYAVEMITGMNDVATSFLNAATSGQSLNNIQIILSGIQYAGVPALTAVTDAAHVLIAVIAGAVPYARTLFDNVTALTGAAATWAQSAEGTLAIHSAWELLYNAGAMLVGVAIDIVSGLYGIGAALAASATGQILIQQIMDLAGQFAYLMSEAGTGREAITSFMDAMGPPLAAILPTIIELGSQFFHVVGAIAEMRNASTGMTYLEEIMWAIYNAAAPLAELFITEFAHIGPLLAPIIENVALWASVFLQATPEILGFIDIVLSLMDAFQTLSPETQTLAARIMAWGSVLLYVGGTFAPLIFYVAATIAAIAGFVGSIIGIIATISGLGITMAVISAAFSVFLSILPIIAVAIGGVLLVIAGLALAAYTLYQNWETVAPAFQAAWDLIVLAFQAAWTLIQVVLAALVTGAQMAFDGIVLALQTMKAAWDAVWLAIGPTVMAALTAVYNFILSLGTQIVTWWQTYFGTGGSMSVDWAALWASIQSVVAWALPMIQTVIQTGLTFIQTLWNAVWPGLSTALMGAWTVIQSVIQGALTIVLGIITTYLGIFSGDWQMAWDGLAMIVEGVWTILSGVVQGGIDIILGILSAGWAWLGVVTQVAWDALQAVITPALDAVGALIDAGIAYVVSVWDAGWALVTAGVQAAWDGIIALLQAAWDTMYSIIDTVLSSIGIDIDTYWNAFMLTITTIGSLIWDLITGDWNGIWTTITGILTSIEADIMLYWNMFNNIIDGVMLAINLMLDGHWNAAWQVILAILDYIGLDIETYWNTFMEIIDSVGQTINETIDTAWNAIWDAITVVLDGISSAISDTWDAIISGAEGFVGLLTDTLTAGFQGAISVAGAVLGGLLDGIAAALSAIGDPLSLAGTLTSAAETVRSYTTFEEGGVAGGIGTGSKKARMHVWNEGMGNEAFIAQKGPRLANMNYLQQAAGWFGMNVVPGPRDAAHGGMKAQQTRSRTPKRKYADGGVAMPARAFEFGGLGATHWDWDDATQQIVTSLGNHTGWCGTPNTYYGHSYIAGATENQSVDWWGGGRGGQLDIGCGNSLQAAGRNVPSLTYDIWQGEHSTAGYWGDHYDHLHETFSGAGAGGGFFCKAIKAGFQVAADAAKAVAGTALDGITDNGPVKSVGKWGIDTGIDSVVQWIMDQLPACSGGSGGGDCMAALDPALEQLGLKGTAFESMMPGLIQCESGGDSSVSNGWDINAINGTPSIGCTQMIQPTFDAYKVPGCDSITDPLCNIMASMNYQNAKYGGAVPGCPYHQGGVIPGTGSASILAQGGERVLSRRQNTAFEDMVYRNDHGSSGGISGGGGGDAVFNINVVFEGDASALRDPEGAATQFADKVLDELMDATREGLLSGTREAGGVR